MENDPYGTPGPGDDDPREGMGAVFWIVAATLVAVGIFLTVLYRTATST